MRYSDSYVMTAHCASAGDMLEVETIRKTVSIINKHNKAKEMMRNRINPMNPIDLPRYRVKLQGRGPRTSAALSDGKYPRKYDQSLPLKHAERVDVYIYEI